MFDRFVVPAMDKVDDEAPVGTRKGGRLRLRRHVAAEQDPDHTRGE